MCMRLCRTIYRHVCAALTQKKRCMFAHVHLIMHVMSSQVMPPDGRTNVPQILDCVLTSIVELRHLRKLILVSDGNISHEIAGMLIGECNVTI